MTFLRVLAAAQVWSATAPAQAQSVDVAAASAAKTFLAEGDGTMLHLRIGSGRQVELFAPATGGRLSGAVRLEVERPASDVVRLNGTSCSAQACARCR